MNAETETAIQNLSKAFADTADFHEADCELARKHRTSSAGHEAIERADGPRSYPLTRHLTNNQEDDRT